MPSFCINQKPLIPQGDCIYLNLETPSEIQVIDSQECIGDSLQKINTNFAKLTSIGLTVLNEKCESFSQRAFSSLTNVVPICASKCIGNSLIDINSNFAALSSFINLIKCDCCDPTSTPT